MAQSLGVVEVVWAGVKFPTEKGATFRQGGLVNKAVTAGAQVSRSQEMMPSRVQCSTPFMTGMSIAAIRAVAEGELQLVCDTGQTFVIASAFLVDQPEITGGEGGKLTLTWEGGEAEELTQ